MSAAKVKNPGRRFAQIVKLKAEHVDEYKKVHAAVWPEVLKQIKDCKMEDCMCSFLCILLVAMFLYGLVPMFLYLVLFPCSCICSCVMFLYLLYSHVPPL